MTYLVAREHLLQAIHEDYTIRFLNYISEVRFGLIPFSSTL